MRGYVDITRNLIAPNALKSGQSRLDINLPDSKFRTGGRRYRFVAR